MRERGFTLCLADEEAGTVSVLGYEALYSQLLLLSTVALTFLGPQLIDS